MNFAKHIDTNKQNLVNDLNTIKSNLESIFNLDDQKCNTESFYFKINGLCSITGRIDEKNNKITLFFFGIEKYAVNFDKEKTLKNLNDNLLPKLYLEAFPEVRGSSNTPCIGFSFNRLTDSVVHDIMILTQATEAQLRPSSIGRF